MDLDPPVDESLGAYVKDLRERAARFGTARQVSAPTLTLRLEAPGSPATRYVVGDPDLIEALLQVLHGHGRAHAHP